MSFSLSAEIAYAGVVLRAPRPNVERVIEMARIAGRHGISVETTR